MSSATESNVSASLSASRSGPSSPASATRPNPAALPTAAFPTASFATVRRVVTQQIRRIPGARRQFWWAIFLLSTGALANVLVPRQLGKIVDEVVADDGSITVIAIWLVALALASAVLSAGGLYVIGKLIERVISNLRETMVGTALRLPAHEVEEAGSGDLVSRATDDVAELSAAVTETVPVLSKSVFMVVATAIALLAIDWQFIAVIAVVVPIYWLSVRHYLRVAPPRYIAQREAMAQRARRVLETIHGGPTVRAYGWERAMHNRVQESSLDVVSYGFAARRTMMTLGLWVWLAEFLLLFVGLLVGFFVVDNGYLTVGAVTAALLMLIRLRGPIMALMRVLDTLQAGYASLSRITGVIARPPQPVPDSGAGQPRGELVVKNVSFAYSADSPGAVDGVSLEVPAGSTVAIVGASGAGKTTLAALAAGLRVQDSGEILVDATEVARLSDRERAGRLAMISQDVYVFSGTLRDDLTLARPDASDEELLAALRTVQADWMDSLADGLDTVVGARGQQLDPVQAQQLALARVLLADPALVIMDEATAEAGSVGAEQLEAGAAAVTAGRTAVIVAHRLDQAVSAEQVVVMDQGRVIEQGTHAELVAQDGRYTELWNAWSSGR
ncbi:ABC transporter ATP-binding protein [Corynebacterium propinquum]|uniref:ABC transporter ATP-binding protein n=1 Tax=Corynebacterium propinquum TaxID=43769 RepID=UPI001EF23770|nr:ABC transporter ATP-binding protein [Corynebacterium propinquum]MCG7230921.1 ABC transporter ATP-binding protein/permease [Corynebacterium propinquum]WKS45012.1 ABC transporter ATP-binding protein/permease [Corynebacterium propinquum]